MTDIRKISETPYNSNTEQINKYVYKKYKIIPILKTEIDKENDIIILEIEHIDFILNTSFDLKDEIEKLIKILLEKLDKLLKNDKKLNKNNIDFCKTQLNFVINSYFL